MGKNKKNKGAQVQQPAAPAQPKKEEPVVEAKVEEPVKVEKKVEEPVKVEEKKVEEPVKVEEQEPAKVEGEKQVEVNWDQFKEESSGP